MKKKTHETILEMCGQNLEAGNYHDLVDLPYNLFANIRSFLDPKDYNEVAQIIADEIDRVT